MKINLNEIDTDDPMTKKSITAAVSLCGFIMFGVTIVIVLLAAGCMAVVINM